MFLVDTKSFQEFLNYKKQGTGATIQKQSFL